ncbi:MAG TPA: hypothetical protein VK249_01280 [Anaerolineales bacterium]|nr:hypothetical protein [Anaerolineales bacterium]
MIRNKLLRFVVLLLFTFVTGCGGQKALTVAEVIQNAGHLDGNIIRVRGLAYLWVDPSQAEMWMFGGCVPKTDPSYRQGVVSGWLILYDSIDPADLKNYGTPHNKPGLKISESSFRCNGDYCKIKCSSFEAVSQRMYEFVGTLQVKENSELILEKIDLDESSQFVDGNWIPVSTGEFDVMFP